MTKLSIPALLVLVMCACGGGENAGVKIPPKIDTTPADNAGDAMRHKAPPETVSLPSAPNEDKWLKIEVRTDDDGFAWHVNGDEKSIGTDEVAQTIADYAAKADEDAGLSGKDSEGISANPIVFEANAYLSSRAFSALVELAASKWIWRIRAVLTAKDGTVRRCWFELPTDMGLLDGPGLLQAYLRVVRDGKHIRYRIGPEPSRNEAISGAAFENARLFDKTSAEEYDRVRSALIRKISQIRSTENEPLDSVQLLATTSAQDAETKDYASWGALFVAIDAISRVNDSRKNTPIKARLRFTDALGYYSDD